MKNIAIIISKLNGGGAERTAANLSMFLKELYNVHLIVFDGRDIAYTYAGTLHDLHMPAKDGLFNKLITFFKRVNVVKAIKKEHHIDYSISLLMGPNLVNILSCVNEKVITSVRNQMSKSRNPAKGIGGFVEERLMRFIGNKSYKVVTPSIGVENDLKVAYRISADKLITIHNPCDYEMLFKKAEKNSIILESGYALITMGRLTEQKGQWHLIRAVSEVKKTFPDVKLYILGQGQLEERLKCLVKELKLENNVKFLGYVEAPHACFKYCDVFILPSEFEGLSNALLEAMAFGLPCISTDCYSGSREILSPGTNIKERLDNIEMCDYGILTSICGPGEFDATSPLTKAELQLVEAIKIILNDNDLRMHYRVKSLERIKDFSPQRIAEEWRAILK